MEISCPGCKNVFYGEQAPHGRPVRCPSCHAVFVPGDLIIDVHAEPVDSDEDREAEDAAYDASRESSTPPPYGETVGVYPGGRRRHRPSVIVIHNRAFTRETTGGGCCGCGCLLLLIFLIMTLAGCALALA